MRNLFIGLVGLACTTCTTNMSQNLTSNWSVLKDTSKVECASWPLRDGELALDGLMTVPGAKPSFIADVRLRNQGRRIGHVYFTDDEEVDADRIATVALPRGAKILGGAEWRGTPHVVVTQTKNGKTALDLRQVPQNIVQHSGVTLEEPIAAAHMLAGKTGIWMTYKNGAEDKSVEETPASIALLKPSADKSTMTMQSFPIRFSDFPALLPSKTGNELIVVWQEAGEGNAKFKIAKINEDGTVAGPQPLLLPVNNAVESWAGTSANGNGYVAYVDGDSMVGQASIKIAKIRWDESVPVVNWVKTRSLSDIHVADPVWVATKDSAYLLIPKWIDEENTVASYKVGADDIEAMAVSGVFPKGTRVESGFYDTKDGKVYAFLRQRAAVGWRYDLCQLKEI